LLEQTHDSRQQSGSGSGGVACENLVAVLVTPVAKGQSTARHCAIVTEVHLLVLIALANGDLAYKSSRRIATRASLGDDVSAKRQVIKRVAAAVGSTLRHRSEAGVG